MKKLAHYWATEYDWRKVEATLNALPQFITNIDGVDIHFIQVRSKHPNALPILITHETWARKAFPHLIHHNKLPKGGHFAAWEQSQEFCDEIRDSFRSLR